MKTLFYNQPVTTATAIADSIIEVLPQYNLVSRSEGKSGHSTTLLFTADTKKLTVTFSHYNQLVHGLSINGDMEDLLSIYKKYLNEKATKEITNKYCAPVLLIALPDQKTLPVSFCKDGKYWTIRTNEPN